MGEFNIEKCQVLHLGKNNPMCKYIPWANEVESSFAGKKKKKWLECPGRHQIEQELAMHHCSKEIQRSWDVLGRMLMEAQERGFFPFIQPQ